MTHFSNEISQSRPRADLFLGGILELPNKMFDVFYTTVSISHGFTVHFGAVSGMNRRVFSNINNIQLTKDSLFFNSFLIA